MITKTVTADEARKNFADLMGEAKFGKGRIEVQRRGKTFCFIIGPDDMDLLEKLEEHFDNLEADEVAAAVRSGEEGTEDWRTAKERGYSGGDGATET